jgi:2-polyprenyl-3-methyl-5-hydroxy-6-metoxy-1,4-benzoquinol methylase
MSDKAAPAGSVGASAYYDAEYFDWQKNIGAFGGWANAFMFGPSVAKDDTVIDFGCGGGFLLKNLDCKNKIGIEPNAEASESIEKKRYSTFFIIR